MLPLLVALPGGCVSTFAWDQGFPDRGEPTARFELESISHDFVLSHGKRYSRETVEPIFRHATPEVLGALAQADAIFEDSQLLQSGLVTALTYAVPETWPNYVDRLRDAVVVVAYGAYFYADYRASEAYKEAAAIYAAALRKHREAPR